MPYLATPLPALSLEILQQARSRNSYSSRSAARSLGKKLRKRLSPPRKISRHIKFMTESGASVVQKFFQGKSTRKKDLY
jgi:hypothetical protein